MVSGLAGRRVLITGASSGIGEAIARDLAAHSAGVALLARRQARLQSLADDIGAVPCPADLRDAAAVHNAVHRAHGELGGLDALVNNAGTFHLDTIATGDPAGWDEMVAVNQLGLLTVTKAALPFLVDSPIGQIVNISSMSGRRVASAATGVYAATKHAVHAISQALRLELHESGIRVTVIAPGTVRTNHGEHIRGPALRERVRREQDAEGLAPCDVAAQVRHVLGLPEDVHLLEIALISSRQNPG